MTTLNFSSEEIQEFTQEATEMLDESEEILGKLKSGADFQSSYDSIFRVFHSLKGGAGMLGMTALQDHMHQLETTFTGYRQLESISEEQISSILEGVDLAREILEGKSESAEVSQKAPPSPQTPTKPESQKPDSVAKNTTQSTPKATQKSASDKKVSLNLDHCMAYIVDDEPFILESLQEILDEVGIPSESFENPLNLLKRYKEKRPTLVVSDIKMPEMTGTELVEEIRKFDKNPEVVFISAYFTKEILLEAFKLGASSVIQKPFQPEQVQQVLVNSIKKSILMELLNRSLNLIMYQFSDLQKYLEEKQLGANLQTIEKELEYIYKLRRELKSLGSNT